MYSIIIVYKSSVQKTRPNAAMTTRQTSLTFIHLLCSNGLLTQPVTLFLPLVCVSEIFLLTLVSDMKTVKNVFTLLVTHQTYNGAYRYLRHLFPLFCVILTIMGCFCSTHPTKLMVTAWGTWKRYGHSMW